ncbi:MAG: helix-turn-helix transcriptional regulator [Delftia acidovorans]|uniref:Helix-turn-helix transcriptional regulator n=1 Tax=Delftia acidovorans TaxID=80866 RepID=A0A7T2S3H4_DELAC|nr:MULTISPECIES: AraC family transcriptional regulator [Delftia]MBB1652908.1 AraC family transcriptional regulator [Delftia sp. UME58]MBL8357337.1 helix-turn-helix transcriptional regulator [Delftia acidovorans]QPS08265.1 helix-turn-helix transcriptional regulator [Delftia acidovorans]
MQASSDSTQSQDRKDSGSKLPFPSASLQQDAEEQDLRPVLLNTLLTSSSPAEFRTRNRLAQAKQYMRARLDDPELKPSQAAQGLDMSLRSLARLFATEGLTPSRWLWNERLAQAHLLLQADNARRVTDVALACGFTSFSHFSRVFRQAYDMPPSALLKPRR